MSLLNRKSNGTATPGTPSTAAAASPPPSSASTAPIAAASTAPTGLPIPATEQPVVASQVPTEQPATLTTTPAAQPAKGNGSNGSGGTALAISTASSSSPSALPVASPYNPGTLAVFSSLGLNPLQPFSLLDDDDVHAELGDTFPIWRMEYAATATAREAGLKRGRLSNMSTMEQQDSLRLVLLAVKLQRVMWPRKFDAANPSKTPLCMSMDSRTATRGEWCDARSDGLFPGRSCEGCPFTRWYKDDEGKSKRDCAPVFVQLMIDRDEQVPVVFGAKKTGQKPFKQHAAQVQLKAMKWGPSSGLIPAAYHCSVGFVLAPKDMGQYFLPEYGSYEQIPADEAAVYESMAASMLKAFAEGRIDISAEGQEVESEDGAGNGGSADRARGASYGPTGYADSRDDEPPRPADQSSRSGAGSSSATDFDPDQLDRQAAAPQGQQSSQPAKAPTAAPARPRRF